MNFFKNPKGINVEVGKYYLARNGKLVVKVIEIETDFGLDYPIKVEVVVNPHNSDYNYVGRIFHYMRGGLYSYLQFNKGLDLHKELSSEEVDKFRMAAK